jgi:hypothetical protein
MLLHGIQPLTRIELGTQNFSLGLEIIQKIDFLLGQISPWPEAEVHPERLPFPLANDFESILPRPWKAYELIRLVSDFEFHDLP